jgi:hypothetical protein
VRRGGRIVGRLVDYGGSDIGTKIVDAGEINSTHPVSVAAWRIQERRHFEPLKQFGKIGANIFRGT